VQVRLHEIDGEDEVLLMDAPAQEGSSC
jgi:hypothetical protein